MLRLEINFSPCIPNISFMIEGDPFIFFPYYVGPVGFFFLNVELFVYFYVKKHVTVLNPLLCFPFRLFSSAFSSYPEQ